ncbi:metallophosphoesterase [Viridibacillus sp. YIM B01967]|uniref:Phosphoesterase n=2 Tax=Viridibacillus soli TaxID=2798301 RepID=A0ABS1H2G6_9BACL|nr:metallophosphoesterase [Viridibacillus soli]
MRILVMSDTHGDATVIERVVQHEQDVDAVFHCGDSELSFGATEFRNMYKVRGNCDYDKQFADDVIAEIDGQTIYMTHGHLYNVKTTLLPLSYRSAEVSANIVLFGHSHLLGAELIDDTLFVNPGSLRLPRGRKEKSYAIIEFDGAKWQVTFKTDTHENISQTSFSIF